MEKITKGGTTMATKKVGTLIKEARTEADLTQEQLARKIAGLSASDISAAERHQKSLTQDQLKQIAKVTGVTQASLLNAAKGTAAKKSTASKSSMQVTATEKKLVQLYREADSDTKKKAMAILRGDNTLKEELFEGLLDTVQDLITGK
jgi:transcriptional regulator with XRE-family HTH domain